MSSMLDGAPSKFTDAARILCPSSMTISPPGYLPLLRQKSATASVAE